MFDTKIQTYRKKGKAKHVYDGMPGIALCNTAVLDIGSPILFFSILEELGTLTLLELNWYTLC